MKRLKPCPFCGGEAKIRMVECRDSECHYSDWNIFCLTCDAEMNVAADNYYGRKSYSRDEAVEFWNTRV